MIDEFGLTNERKYLDAAATFRHAAIADGWSCIPTYGDRESAESHATLEKDGFKCHVMARELSGKKYQYQAQVSIWGPDGLCITAPVLYDWDVIESGVRRCGYCGQEDVDTQRVGFAGRSCEKCLPVARKRDEYPGWTR